MTAIRSEMLDDRQVVGDEEVSQGKFALSSSIRLMIWAWIETSRADTGSSATMKSGFTASARAIPIR